MRREVERRWGVGKTDPRESQRNERLDLALVPLGGSVFVRACSLRAGGRGEVG